MRVGTLSEQKGHDVKVLTTCHVVKKRGPKTVEYIITACQNREGTGRAFRRWPFIPDSV